ncbi:MAG: PTS sugar transporter subunit IIB [Planctomycetaceae bacterium]|nr:PTS sugar transporter subunit IIB [Planctomycetaceae bacterium]
MIKLVRLDHRLLHGQVVFAWVQSMGIQRIIIIDDAAATDDLKKTALNLTKPPNVRLNIFTLETALAKMPKVEELQENIMLIFGNTRTMRQFCETYQKIESINYGGLP